MNLIKSDLFKIKEKYIDKYGWTLITGLKLDLSELKNINDGVLYLTIALFEEISTQICFYHHANYDDIFEDIDELITFIEEHNEEKYEDFEIKYIENTREVEKTQ